MAPLQVQLGEVAPLLLRRLLRHIEPLSQIARAARFYPARLAVIVFAAIIVVVTGLLSLPIATTSGERANFLDALFTATSAVCVTGLSTVDTAAYWSTFGHVVIILAAAVLAALIMMRHRRRRSDDSTGELTENQTDIRQAGECARQTVGRRL